MIFVKITEAARNSKIDSTQSFFDQHFKDKKYTYMIVGSKKDVDLLKLKTVGPVNELALKDIFNY